MLMARRPMTLMARVDDKQMAMMASDGKGRPANGDRTVVGGWWAPYITKAPTDSPPPLMSS